MCLKHSPHINFNKREFTALRFMSEGAFVYIELTLVFPFTIDICTDHFVIIKNLKLPTSQFYMSGSNLLEWALVRDAHLVSWWRATRKHAVFHCVFNLEETPAIVWCATRLLKCFLFPPRFLELLPSSASLWKEQSLSST